MIGYLTINEFFFFFEAIQNLAKPPLAQKATFCRFRLASKLFSFSSSEIQSSVINKN